MFPYRSSIGDHAPVTPHLPFMSTMQVEIANVKGTHCFRVTKDNRLDTDQEQMKHTA